MNSIKEEQNALKQKSDVNHLKTDKYTELRRKSPETTIPLDVLQNEYQKTLENEKRWAAIDNIVKLLKEGHIPSGNDKDVFVESKKPLTPQEITDISFRAVGLKNYYNLDTSQMQKKLERFNEEIKRDIQNLPTKRTKGNKS
jgi:F0F1-type ATP synthase delta subunit